MVADNTKTKGIMAFMPYRLFWFQVIIVAVAMTFFVSSLNVFAATKQEANNAGKKFADSMNVAIGNKAKKPVITDIPHYQGENVPAKKYYNSGVGIENEAHIHAVNDEYSKFILSARDSRPIVDIDRENDLLFKREEDILSLSRSLTSTYTGCVDLPVGDTDLTIYDNKSCNIKGIYYYEYPVCNRTYRAYCTNGATYHEPYNKTIKVNLGSKGRNYLTVRVNFITGSWSAVKPSDGIKKVAFFDVVSLEEACEDNTTSITYRGASHWRSAPSHVGGGPHDNTVIYRELQRPSCLNGFIGKYQIEDIQKARETKYVLGGRFTYTLRFKAKCTEAFTKSYSCNVGGGYNKSLLHSKSCIDSGHKIVSGFSLYKDCWNWKEIFQIEKIRFKENPLCDQLRSEGCGFISSSCTHKSNKGHCLNEEKVFSCPRVEAARHVELCGNVLSCPDGHCADEYKTQKDATEDFKQAASSLALANEIAKEFDYNELSLFKGEGKQCSKSVLGFYDCCKSDGWSDDIGLLDCSTEEKALRIKREQKAAHYVGTYCSREVLKDCVSRKYTYCTYPSKLARIIIEQGNSQLGRGYGSAERPDCSGFSIEQLSSLDFNAMSLREFYPDVVQKTARGTVADPNQLVKDIADKLNNTGGD